MNRASKKNPQRARFSRSRRGNILVLSACFFVVIMAFTAFTVDVGYIAVSKAELQNAADAAALAAVGELPAGFGAGASLNQNEVDEVARQAAVDVAAANAAGDVGAVYTNGDRDVRFGQLQWDADSGTWQKSWGVAPYNLAEVSPRRNEEFEDPNAQNPVPNTGGDRPLKLFFAPVIGHSTSGLAVSSTAAMLPGGGFRIRSGSGMTIGVLPIALDDSTWNQVMAGVGADEWSYNSETGAITAGHDGIVETNLYPTGTSLMPPGNRGTVDLGSPNNSTNDIKRQILYGLNEYDLSFFGGELRFDSGPLLINGDTGLSAAIKDELTQIKGQPRAIPIFTSVSGPGNNAMYTVIKFVGIRILDVQLTGSPSKKRVTVQPAPFVAATVVSGDVEISEDTIFTKPVLVK